MAGLFCALTPLFMSLFADAALSTFALNKCLIVQMFK
nr:MAG TPA: hypothetical protein [Caudoviricetes sp.]